MSNKKEKNEQKKKRCDPKTEVVESLFIDQLANLLIRQVENEFVS